MKERILVVEDDQGLSDLLCRGLAEEGFVPLSKGDGIEAAETWQTGGFDLVLLDLMLPGMDGMSLCRQARARGDTTPVIMLTAKGAIGDKVAGLHAGADDYLAKPFDFDELLARVHALLRRAAASEHQNLSVADLRFDLITRRVTQGGHVIDLTGKETAVLHHLLSRQGQVVSEQELLEEVWGIGFDPGTNIVNVYIHHLRDKLDRHRPVKLIHTVRGRGYLLTEDSGEG